MKTLDIQPAPILNVTEAAGYLRTSRATLYKLMKGGQLQYVKIGNSTRITKEALDRMIAASGVVS